jgi:carbamoylphosphate synthase large subunit
MAEQHTVLIGSAGAGTGFAAACAIRRVWSNAVRIVSMDSNWPHLCTSSLLSDVHEKVPLFSDRSFASVLAEIVARHSIDTYLPLFPGEIEMAARLMERGLEICYPALVPQVHTAALCNDKLRLATYLSDCGVAVPETFSVSEAPNRAHFFLKPISGNGSVGARRVGISELMALPAEDKASSILQEICTGPEITVDTFYGGKPLTLQTICRERIETKSGVTTKSRLFKCDALHNLAGLLADCLKLTGTFCFQVMQDSRGRTVVTDVNPRPGAATAMSVAAGSDFIAATFANAWGDDCERFFKPLGNEVYVTRQYTEFVMTGAVSG